MATKNAITLVSHILEDIGTTANALKGELIELAPDTTTAIGRRLYTLETLAAKIGWLADLGLLHATGSEVIVGDAEQWFMPPSYLGEKETSESHKG